MSSEERIRQTVLTQADWCVSAYGDRHHPSRCPAFIHALDAYRTFIERRVLAQQPCRLLLEGVAACRTEPDKPRCTTCTARMETARAAQTTVEQGNAQETSG